MHNRDDERLPAAEGWSSFRDALYARYVSSVKQKNPISPLDDARSYTPYLQQLIGSHFPADRGARILDLGCGQGSLLRLCREAGYRQLQGVDISSEQIEAATDTRLASIVKGDLLSFLREAPDRYFDVVIAFDVLEHLSRPNVFRVFGEVRRVLTESGRFIVHVPNGDSPFVGTVLFGDFTHETAFTRRSIRQIARTAGFSGVECYEDAPVVHGLKSGLRRALWSLVRLILRGMTAVETGDLGRDAILSRNILAVISR